ncbi:MULTISPECIES: hypothetical protein [Ralstonia solanacearum species complex]|uniref:Uncharacterized protein n=3 Tax=Ralstonia solanacearum TaxID=305 RepID=A0AB33VHJ0_RALSU|nr:hypothetical protein [Ralstonia solanacearum]ALF89616.1 hypothetical protein RSUY_33050 [Ralstonia solanacearum]ATI29141.1 hypothetical protein CCY86_16510 [Ralstonia solanacearum]ATJ87911.1 hypothetical protein CDC59_16415 [Ralstonia solanacearum]EAP74334.1 Hypothetical Protein RRSL_04053 [Ralstonia solanacearum UW551]KEI31125.1 hypothetical protein CQ06_01065 [Ralstonia solanacearum]
MPITLTAFTVQKEWEGCTWSVPSVDELANAIAIIAVGQALHVANILHVAGLAAKPTTKSAVKGAIKLLTSSGNIAHRDGWMFQVMSWLAAQVRTPGALMNTPHMIHAHKGLDGLQVSIDGAGKVAAVILFEDKATENPRSMVLNKVWPEFTEFETGENEHLVTAEVTLLLKSARHSDPQQAVADIMWNQVRRYRLSITDQQSTNQSQAKLFKGYEKNIPGGVERRRAEVFEVIGLRKWMADLAQAAIKKAEALATTD